MNSFSEDLKRAVAYHGHLCSGQVLGVRMARLGLKQLGITDPASYRDLIVYVEADRCIADAVAIVTGCKPGRRRLKFFDYGKMAVSLLDLKTAQAFRISSIGEKLPEYGDDPVRFFSPIPDEQLFRVTPVTIHYSTYDLPGKPLEIVRCECCGEEIFDHRQVSLKGQIFCQSCAFGAYFTPLKEHPDN